ncbi:MAG: Rv3235 family protein [Nitriliruptorales bacterium]
MSTGPGLPTANRPDGFSGRGFTPHPTVFTPHKASDAAGHEGASGGTAPHSLPADQDPERLAHAVARVFLEVEVGRRPLHQLSPVLAPALRARLAVAAHRPGPGPTLDAVIAVRSYRPHPNACDAAVVVRRGQRVGALVVRLERHRAVWRVVELARPEDRPPQVAG